MSNEDFDAFNTDALVNAEKIIERFGGIRPMAAKVGAPVTTVQGWKKRDVIPGSRRDDVLKAANENNIDLSDLVKADEILASSRFGDAPESAAVPPVEEAKKIGIAAFIHSEPLKTDAPKMEAPKAANTETDKADALKKAQIFVPPYDSTHDDLMAAIAVGQKKAVRASLWGAVAIVAICAGVGTFLLWPSAQKIEKNESQIAVLQDRVNGLDTEVKGIDERSAFFKGLMPEDLQQKMTDLQTQAKDIEATVTKLSGDASAIASGVVGPDAGSLSQRLSVIETRLEGIEGTESIQDLIARIKTLETSLGGQQQLTASIDELRGIVDSLDGQVNTLDKKLAQTQETANSALGQTLNGVSSNDLKAAAMLIAFSQLRESLNRSAPFEDDLALLQKLVGNDDPELQTNLARLAPYAEQGGVLTAEGLSGEFKTLAGDIVVSSLKGEDVSLKDKAKARMAELFSVKKDGQLMGGTPTQDAVVKAQAQLDKGDVKGAIATLQSLDGEAAQTAAPFIQQAQGVMLAEQVETMLRQTILSNIGNSAPLTATGAAGALNAVTDSVQEALPGQGGLVRDKESGFAILPAPKGFKGFSSGPTE